MTQRNLPIKDGKKREWLKGDVCGWTFLTVGLICLLVAAAHLAMNSYIVATYEVASGTVLSNRDERERRKGGEVTIYYPLVEFSDADGRQQQIEATYSLFEPLPTGTVIPVYYLPSNPAAAQVGGDGFWESTLGFFVFGALFSTVGSAFVFGTRWAERRWPGSMKRL